VVADVGAGTGKFTPLLAATGADVIAIEPVDAMRAQIVARQPTVRALPGTAQALGLPGASLDAIVCAQAFHWFADRAALDEFARVLKPGARLGLVWNVRDESVDWVAALTRIMTPYEGDAPRFTRAAGARFFRTRPSGRYRRACSSTCTKARPSRSSWTASCRSASSPRCRPASRRGCARGSRR
jgi:SAM-dependent methyltransferase